MRCIVLLIGLALAQGSVSSSNGSSNTKPVLSGSKPDPWVEAAPLILGAVCRNGVALLAIHPTQALQNDENKTNEENGRNNHDEDDWTDTYRDTARIHQIDSQGTALLCSGWRTDGEWLAETCRSISRDEVRSFGAPSSPILAEDASLWMAHCTASDTVRPLSVVGLLASMSLASSSSDPTTNGTRECFLHLVDATGAYRVRAHAVGFGAKTVNARLRAIRFDTMSADEGIDRLVQVLLASNDEREEPEGGGGNDKWQPLKNSTRVELAIVDAERKCLRRIRQPYLVLNSCS